MNSVFVWTPADVMGLIVLAAIFVGGLLSALGEIFKSRKRK